MINNVVPRDVNQAVDYVFANNVQLNQNSAGGRSAASSNYNQQTAKSLFDGFKSTNDMGEVVMDFDGINSFTQQIGVNAETDVVFVKIAQYMQAKYMGEFTWDEFNRGCAALGCDSIASWQAVLPRLRQELNNQAKNKEMYHFAF